MATYLWIEEDKYTIILFDHILWNVDKTIRDIKEKIERVNKAFHPEESLTGTTYLVTEERNRKIWRSSSRIKLPSFRRYKYTEEKKLKLIDKNCSPKGEF